MNIKYILLVCCVLLESALFGQSQVLFNIHHKLASEQFELEKIADNNINTPFQLTRLEYYISEISLIHDGGQETPVSDLYILVNASAATNVDLGVFNIANLEKVKFHIGVDPGHNNADPASYKEDHPLAPKDPAMHWGWASGYNFIALEGLGGQDQDKIFQIHALGNENYHEIVLNTETSAVNGQISVDINADYTRALEDLDASTGMIYHGTAKFAKDLISNFKDMVFSSATVPASNLGAGKEVPMVIYPNPSLDGIVHLRTHFLPTESLKLMIIDQKGQNVLELDLNIFSADINLNGRPAGPYFISIYKDGKLSGTKKIMLN